VFPNHTIKLLGHQFKNQVEPSLELYYTLLQMCDEGLLSETNDEEREISNKCETSIKTYLELAFSSTHFLKIHQTPQFKQKNLSGEVIKNINELYSPAQISKQDGIKFETFFSTSI